MAGKAYANRKKKKDRPEGDFYVTPRSLVWAASGVILSEFDKSCTVLEPCSGENAISDELKKIGYTVEENDLLKGGVDYLSDYPLDGAPKSTITNPPFSLWDEFVQRMKLHSEKVMVIGRLNYLGTNSRYTSGIWNGLKAIYCFNRYVDYRTPLRSDGLFHVGAMATGWFLWQRGYQYAPAVYILDVQQYASLGNFNG